MNAVLGRIGIRKTVLIGGLCTALSSILATLATDVTSLVLSQAVFHGRWIRVLNCDLPLAWCYVDFFFQIKSYGI